MALTKIRDAGMPAGAVVQVQQTIKTDAFTTTSTSMTDVTGLSVNITPTSSSSKIMVVYDVTCTGGHYVSYIDVVRDSTALALPDAAGSRPQHTSIQTVRNELVATHGGTDRHNGTILDSPATTSQITYKIQTKARSTHTAYVNRSEPDRDNADYDGRQTSTLTVMEIAG
jgi:hypothetical protein